MSDQATIKDKFQRLRPAMDERLCRLWAANEARTLGFGGETLVCAATGLSRATIRVGLSELEGLATSPEVVVPHPQPPRRPRVVTESYRIRRPGGGRKLTEMKDPGIVAALERLLTDEVAGDPMSEQKWMRSSLRRLSQKLSAEGNPASSATVGRLLKDMGFSLKANQRKGSCWDISGGRPRRPA